jgi:hypothetical protein
MTTTLCLYVDRADGSSYCEASIREDEPDARNRIDREAWHWLSRSGVIGANVVIESGRAGGYRRR